MTAVKFCDFCLYVFCFAVTHCNAASEIETKMCLPRDSDCSCLNGHAVKATVKYCGNNSGKCLPCEDLRTLCLKRCHEIAAAVPLHRLRERRQLCSVVDKAVSEGPPNVIITSGLHGTKVVDQDLDIECQVKTNPAAHVSWLFNGQPLSESLDKRRYELRYCNKTLHIDTVELSDAGNYTCVGRNKFGFNTASSIISVRIATKDVLQILSFDIEKKYDHAYAGGTVKLMCKALADKGSITFEKSGKMVNEDGRLFYRQLSNATDYVETALEINNVSAWDTGNYFCVAFDRNWDHVKKHLHLAVVPCPKGHFCPHGENEKHLCPPGTYNNGTRNVTYECTACPFKPGNDSTKLPSGVTSMTDCPQEEASTTSPRIDPPGGNNNMIGYISIPVGVLAFIVIVVVVGLRCFLAKRRPRPSGDGTNCLHIDVLKPGGEINGGNSAGNEGTNLEAKYDVFICYSSKDTKFVQELIEELERRQFKCCVDFRDFVAGAPIVENITDAIYSSKKTLAVLSPDFVESKWCKHEIQQALARISSHLVVPLLLKDCSIPHLLRDRTYLDWESSVVKPHFWNVLDLALRA